MKNILKFAFLTVVAGLFVFGCSQTDEPLQGPSGISSGILSDAIGLDNPKAPAEGNEELGIPGITIAAGTKIFVNGDGLRFDGQADITVPAMAGATVEQVLLYWEGFHTTGTGDNQVTVNSTHTVTGTQLNDTPVNFFTSDGGAGDENWSVSYRADITSLGLVTPAGATITVEDYVVNRPNGAGILVIYNDGSANEVVGVRDGDDCAYYMFAPPLDTTVPQIFSFASATVARTANLHLMAGSVQAGRPNTVMVTFDVGSPVEIADPYSNEEGEDFDVETVAVPVPAGATQMTVQCLSQEATGGITGRPASMVWICAALDIEKVGGDSCTPGYWKNFRMHFCEWDAAGYTPTMDFDGTMGTDYFNPDISLMAALKAKGGDGNGYGRLARHGTAALLNAANPDVDYPLTVDEVKAAVQAGNASLLAGYNEDLPCLLNNCKDNSSTPTD